MNAVCYHQDGFYSGRSWLFCHSHASPSPKLAKWYRFCVNNRPSFTHLSVACERTFLQICGPSVSPFWNMLHLSICKALSTEADTDLIYPRMQLGPQWQACTCSQFSYIAFVSEVAVLPQKLGCRCFTHTYCEFLAVSEAPMLMGCGHHMWTDRIQGNMERIVKEYIFLNLLNM